MFLGKAISMLESHSEKQKKTRSELLTQCLQHTQKRAKRLGISGVPGVGKSTFIEAIGELIVSNDKTLAVLAVDPSSLESKGSILGDKTRMEKLSNHPNVFIRPSPSGSALGGVTRSTYETILLFEAAGFDYILIETVGVGQAEYIVRNMVDFFLLLTLPVAGDDLQGIKRGIMEVADLVAINKSEGELIPKANITQKQLEESLHYFRKPYSFWNPSVLQIAALSQVGIKELLAKIEDFFSKSTANGYLTENRKQQALLWFEENLNHEFLKRLSSQPKFVELKKQTTQNILGQHISAFQGVDEILKGVKVSL